MTMWLSTYITALFTSFDNLPNAEPATVGSSHHHAMSSQATSLGTAVQIIIHNTDGPAAASELQQHLNALSEWPIKSCCCMSSHLLQRAEAAGGHRTIAQFPAAPRLSAHEQTWAYLGSVSLVY